MLLVLAHIVWLVLSRYTDMQSWQPETAFALTASLVLRRT